MLLAGNAGFTDAVAYLTLKVFVANFTGTVVLLGIASTHADTNTIRAGLVSIAAFLCGIVSARLLRRMTLSPGPPLLAATALLAIDALLMPAAMIAIALLACSMGLQNASIRTFAGVSLNTAFVTGDMETLGEAVAGSIAPRRADPDRQTRIGMIAAVVTTYGCSAAAAAFALHRLASPLLVPFALLLAATLLTSRTGPRA